MKNLIILLFLLSFLKGFSVTYYWKPQNGNVGDTANWATDTVNWIGARALPAYNIDVRFTYAAGNVTATMNANLNCNNFDCRGWIGSIASLTGNLRIYKDAYFYGTFSSSISVIFLPAAAVTANVYTNGRTLAWTQINNAGTVVFMDNLTTTTNGRLVLTIGTFNLNGKTYTIGYCQISASASPSALIMGNSTVTLTNANGLDFETNGSNFTFTCDSSTIHLTNSSASTVFKGNSKTFNNVYFDGTTGGGVISGSNTFAELKFAPTTAKTYQFTDGTTQTITTLTATGSSGKNITLKGTSTAGWTLSKTSGSVVCDYVNLYYCTASGGATFTMGCYSFNIIGNSGWEWCQKSPFILVYY
jgi:hypothetical protein